MLENAVDVFYKSDESNRFNIVDSISRTLNKRSASCFRWITFTSRLKASSRVLVDWKKKKMRDNVRKRKEIQKGEPQLWEQLKEILTPTSI